MKLVRYGRAGHERRLSRDVAGPREAAKDRREEAEEGGEAGREIPGNAQEPAVHDARRDTHELGPRPPHSVVEGGAAEVRVPVAAVAALAARAGHGGRDALADGDAIVFAQDSMVVSDLLDLIIAEGRAARGLGPAAAGAADPARRDGPGGLLGGAQ